MKHTIRQNGQLTQIDCELGSGILDENGKEIFEGDIVKCRSKESGKWEQTIVTFENGFFWGVKYALSEFLQNELEVVGHAAEEN